MTKRGFLLFRAEGFHLKPRPEIEGIHRSAPVSTGMADIRIARARRQVKRVGDFTFDLISVSLISRVANERSQSFSVANGSSSSRSAKTESGFSASGRRTKGDNTRCRDHADRSETKCFQSTWDFFHPCYPARLCQDHMYKSPIPPIKVPV